jgi:hypothetical protein
MNRGDRGETIFLKAQGESDPQKAERSVAQMLSQRGWTQTELSKRKKRDREKVMIAARLRR